MREHAGRSAMAFVGLGIMSAGVSGWFALQQDNPIVNKSTCPKQLEAGRAAEINGSELLLYDPTEDDRAGILRIVGIYPETIELGETLCIVVAGVVPESTKTEPARVLSGDGADLNLAARETIASTSLTEKSGLFTEASAKVENPREAAGRHLPSTELNLYLNDALSEFKLQAKSVSEPQALSVRMSSQDNAKGSYAPFWHEILRDSAVKGETRGEVPVVAGLSRVSDNTKIPDASATETFGLRVFQQRTMVASCIALGFFVLAFGFYAWSSNLLRDSKLTKATLLRRRTGLQNILSLPGISQERIDQTTAELQLAEGAITGLSLKYGTTADGLPDLPDDWPIGTFSLARVQMAIWFFIVVAAFIFVSASIGHYLNLVTPNVIALLGISGATGLASIALADKQAEYRISRNFFRDVLSDQSGPQMQRIQALVWTVILGAIFVWVALCEFRLVEFDTSLLLLMGVASGLYVGFKAQET